MSLLTSLAAASAAATLSAQTPAPQERPETLSQLLSCRTVIDSAARLACFDAAAGTLETAERAGELVVFDRARAAEARRQLFGFSVTMPSLFRGETASEIDSVESTLQSASRNSEGRWVFRLADGAAWRQIDSESVRFANESGQPVRVRKAAMGSFLLTVGDSRAVRVRRQ